MKRARLLHFGRFEGLKRDDQLDLGYDLPGIYEDLKVEPNSMVKINTGLRVEFPLYGWFRRLTTRIMLGVNVTGVGAMIRPRGGSDIIIGSGVIDAGYRGEIVVKVINPTDRPIMLWAGKPFAQLVPKLVIDMPTGVKIDINEMETKRGSKGGIWRQ